MKNYFPAGNWEEKVYRKLNELIEQNQQAQDVPLASRPYVVFDCDDTTIYSDTELETLYYVLEHLLFQETPEELADQLYAGDFDYQKPLVEGEDNLTGDHLVTDIVEAYETLYAEYIAKETDRPTLADIHDSSAFKNFFVKYINFYNLQWAQSYEKPGLRNAVAFFSGMSKEQLTHIAINVAAESLTSPIEQKHLFSCPEQTGKTGQLSVKIQTGMRMTDELKSLYQAFEEHGIVVYVVSGSVQEMVNGVLGQYYQMPEEQIFSMTYQDEEGILTDRFADHLPTTLGYGKVETIQKEIMPLHQGRQPLAIFGNSSGDYDMLTAFDQLALGVFFNRNSNDRSQNIVKKAVEHYESDQSPYVLQGVDENTGQLIPSQSTIPYGQDQPLLFAKDSIEYSKYSQ